MVHWVVLTTEPTGLPPLMHKGPFCLYVLVFYVVEKKVLLFVVKIHMEVYQVPNARIVNYRPSMHMVSIVW